MFAPPLTHDSVPIRDLVLTDGSLHDLEGDQVLVAGSDMLDSCPVGNGDAIWVTDMWHSRVLRISNLEGAVRPGYGPYVDVVLGQADLAGTSANRGLTHPAANTLATPYDVAVGPDGSLFVSDNGGEAGSNFRILRFDASLFPAAPAQTLFGIPATRVYGAGGNFNILGWQSQDPLCSPFELAFDPEGAIIAPMNGYSSQRFPLVYLDPLSFTTPQFAMGDMTSYPDASFSDADGNLYIGDFDWSRLLIYKKPFKNLYATLLPGDANCDGLVNNGDIDAFVLALTNSAAYALQYPGCNLLNADCNSDGLVNNGDIDAFVALLTGG
jgi:hypothetical protein